MKRVYFMRYPHGLVTVVVVLFAALGGLLTWIPGWVLPALPVGAGEGISRVAQTLAQILEFIRIGL